MSNDHLTYKVQIDLQTDGFACRFSSQIARAKGHRGSQSLIPARADMYGGCSGIILMYMQASLCGRTSQADQMSRWLDSVPRMDRYSAPNSFLQSGAIVQPTWLLSVQCSNSSESLCRSLHHADRLPGAYAQRGTLNPVVRLQMAVTKNWVGGVCLTGHVRRSSRFCSVELL